MRPRELLEAARAKIAEPEHWTQDVEARDAYGNEVGAEHLCAVCWCAGVALWFVAAEQGVADGIAYDDAAETLNAAAEATRGTEWTEQAERKRPIAHLNDYRSDGGRAGDHARVLAAFDRAVAMSAERETGE